MFWIVFGSFMAGVVCTAIWWSSRTESLKKAFTELLHNWEGAKNLNQRLLQSNKDLINEFSDAVRDANGLPRVPTIEELMKPETIELMRIATLAELDRLEAK